MKRILHVVSTLEQGGMETVVLNYFAHMPKDEIMFDFLVIYGSKRGYHEDYLLSQGCKIFKLQNPPNKYFAHGNELKKFFAGEKYDIVHIHAMTSLRYRVAKAAKKSGVATVIYHSHTALCERHKILHSLIKHKLNKWCDYKFACSEIAGKFMYSGEFQIIHNAIDIKRFGYDMATRENLRSEYELNDKYIIGHIGRFVGLKNQQFLIKIMPYVKRVNKNAMLFLVGDGETKEDLQKMVNSSDLSTDIIFAGNVGTDVYKYYNMFDCLAFPSHFEGLSMVLIEAQANGLPIIASNTLSCEHKIAENFTFMPIDESEATYEAWAECICNNFDNRKDNYMALQNAGYDISKEHIELQTFYLNCDEKVVYKH